MKNLKSLIPIFGLIYIMYFIFYKNENVIDVLKTPLIYHLSAIIQGCSFGMLIILL